MLKPEIRALQISEVAQCGTDQRKKENIQDDVHPGDNSRQGLKRYQRSFFPHPVSNNNYTYRVGFLASFVLAA